MHNDNEPRRALLDYNEAATFLGRISRSTLKTLVGDAACLLESVRVGRRQLFPVQSLEAYVDSFKRTNREPAA